MKQSRDPRIDPVAGDELVIFHGGSMRWWRKVLNVSAGVRYMTNSGKQREMPLERWRDQMRNAIAPLLMGRC